MKVCPPDNTEIRSVKRNNARYEGLSPLNESLLECADHNAFYEIFLKKRIYRQNREYSYYYDRVF